MLDCSLTVQQVPLPLFIAGRDISLGAGISQRFADVASMKGILAKRPFAFLRDSAFALNAALLPTPLLQGTIATAVQPIPGTKPFQVNTSAIIANSLLKTPPILAMQVTKEIGERKHAFCSWSSGTIPWPSVLQVLFSPIANLGLDTESAISMTAFAQPSQFQLGFLSVPTPNRNTIVLGDDEDHAEEDEGEEEAEFRQIRRKARSEANAAESWQAVVTASPQEAGLSFTYARNIFNGKAASELARSEWSSEGHYSLPPASEPRSVRVEVRSSVNMDLSLAWNISGTRQVGRFTRVGFGVGVQGGRGLVMTASWSRLGQKISLPVAVCPMDVVNADAAALAVILPWAVYCALEFGYIRPRERRQRRRAIARRHKQLKRLIPKKKAESQQAIELMAEHVHRRQAREEEQGGLVITKAEYGHYPSPKGWINDSANATKDLEIADVTIPVAALVDHGQLVITKDTVKFQILGFYDPAPLLPKKLKIWYTYRGKEHFVEANDSEGIACPMRTHLLG
jgi:DnaJ family protein C protein 11